MISGGLRADRDLARAPRSSATVWLRCPKIAAAANTTTIATMATKQRDKTAKASKARGGHLRSKVEKRDDDIIHVRRHARIPSPQRFKDLPDNNNV